jgi:hypothetical protein
VVIHYRIVDRERLLLVRLAGHVSVVDFGRLLETIFSAHPEAIQFDVLCDARSLVSFLSGPEVEDVARLVESKRLDEYSRLSIVLVSQPAQYGLARMFALMTERGSKVARHVTTSVEEAARASGRTEEGVRAALESGEWHALT